MLDFITSWSGLLLGGGLVTTIVLFVVAYLLGARAAVELVVDFLRPIATTVSKVAADFFQAMYFNLKDGAAHIAKNGKAILFLITCCLAVAGFIYFPTAIKAEKRGAEKQVRELRKNFRFVAKKKPAKTQWVPTVFGYKGK